MADKMDLIDPNTITDDEEITMALAYAAEQQYLARMASQRVGRPLTPEEQLLILHVQALLERRRAIRHALTGC